MEHTKEPWGVIDGKIVGDVREGGELADLITDCGWEPRGEADARRIVACVNACRGMPTEEIEEALKGELTLKQTMHKVYEAFETARHDAEVKLVERNICASERDNALRERDEARAMVAELVKTLELARTRLPQKTSLPKTESEIGEIVAAVDAAIVKAKAPHA